MFKGVWGALANQSGTQQQEGSSLVTVRWRLMLLWFLVLAQNASAQNALQPYQEYDKKIRTSEQVSPLKSDLFGESISLYDQRTSFQHTDIDLAGSNSLPVAFGRRLVVRPVTKLGFPPEIFGGAADWDIEVPSISGVFDSAYGWNKASGGINQPRCSTNFYPHTNPPHQVEEIWSGYNVNIPGRGSFTLIGHPNVSHRPADGQTRVWMTREFDTFSCVPMASGYPGEGFVMQTTSGIKYIFNVGVTRSAGLMGRDNGSVNSRTRIEVFILASRIEDRFGNSVSYTYNASGHPTRIEGSDGRRIDITYQNGRVASASAHGQIWNYQYANDRLASVVLPDQSFWAFAYQSDMRVFYERWTEDPGPGCGGIAPVPVKEFGLVMTHPSGAIGTFGFNLQRHFRSGVPQILCVAETIPGSTTISHTLSVPNYFDVLGITAKSIQGPGLSQPLLWTYSDHGTGHMLWSGVVPPCTTCIQGKIVESNLPDGSKVLETYGIVFSLNEGKLLAREVVAGNGAVLRSENLTYLSAAEVASQPFPNSYGSMYGGNDPSAVLIRPLKSKTIFQSGDAYTWSADAFDVFARPTVQRTYSSANQSVMPPTTAPVLSLPSTSTTGSFGISWTAIPDAAEYRLEESANGGGWTQIQAAASVSRAVSGKGDGSYSYRVRACNAPGCGPYSSIGTVQVDVLLPPAPAPVITAPGTSSSGSYTVSWTNVPRTTSYELFESLNGGTPNSLYPGMALSMAITGRSGGTWSYTVRACNAAGCISSVAVSTVVQLPVLPVPAVPTGLTVKQQSSELCRVTWSAVSGAAWYVLSGAGFEVQSSPLRAYSYDAQCERPYRVRACNDSSQASCSAWSAGV